MNAAEYEIIKKKAEEGIDHVGAIKRMARGSNVKLASNCVSCGEPRRRRKAERRKNVLRISHVSICTRSDDFDSFQGH